MGSREDAIAIFLAAVKAVDPVSAIRQHVSIDGQYLRAGSIAYDIRRFRRVLVVGAGKAGGPMAAAIEGLLSSRIGEGWVSVKDGHLAEVQRIHLHECGHPVPDDRGVVGAQRIADIAASAGEDDLLICLLSGGASALLPLPAEPVSLAMKQETTRLLLNCGATINEINAVRKHISGIKGGQLAALAYPATVLSLILSDVIGNDLDVIGSGITAPDSSTFATALLVLRKYELLHLVPGPVRQRIQDGVDGRIAETPKHDHPAFARTQNVIVGSNDLALTTAAARAEELGYQSLVLSSFIEGETREIAKMHTAIAKEILAFQRPIQPPCCVISGGETTVTIRGGGKGGRNQEFALAAAIEVAGLDGVTVLSGGTDGTDGPTDAAGAVCDGETIKRAESAGLNASAHLQENNSYEFFEPLGDLLKTGPTGTNVADVRLLLIRE